MLGALSGGLVDAVCDRGRPVEERLDEGGQATHVAAQLHDLVRAAAANAHNLGPVHTALRKLRMVAPGGRVQALRETAAAVA